ncbi:UNVERIFIED_CONTAM: Transposon Ty3-G Gag-Pol polyprotein [Sesamum angustifolium]|uniref:Transposon Ty3-G Gag-Pol polyprotein n=1 Tax=Sesamum angustifolium TaxID=2727405 RepID=A0AAW2INC5_9LAMI
MDSGSSADILFGEAYDEMHFLGIFWDSEVKKDVPVQPVEELLTIELIPSEVEKVIKIGSKVKDDVQEETPQDLEVIGPDVITYHLNIYPSVRPMKQKKWYFGLEKDKIIQVEVNKLLAAGHIQEIQFSEWLSNIVLIPKPKGKWRMCIDFRDLNKACPKDSYMLPRINQLVDSVTRCELLSMMVTSQGNHQIMLAPKHHKRVSFLPPMELYATWPCPSG